MVSYALLFKERLFIAAFVLQAQQQPMRTTILQTPPTPQSQYQPTIHDNTSPQNQAPSSPPTFHQGVHLELLTTLSTYYQISIVIVVYFTNRSRCFTHPSSSSSSSNFSISLFLTVLLLLLIIKSWIIAFINRSNSSRNCPSETPAILASLCPRSTPLIVEIAPSLDLVKR